MNAIVVGVDASRESRYAVEWAAAEAARRGSRLRIMCTERHLLDEAVAAAGECAPPAGVEAGHLPGPVGRIVAEQAGAAMLVLGGRDDLRQVVADALVPVITVWEPPFAARGEIVVGIDGSAIDEPAVGFSLKEAALREARLRMIHIWPYPAYRRPGEAAPSEWHERLQGVRIVSDVLHGDPDRILIEASTRADLLVVGGRHHDGRGLPDRPRCPLAVVPGGRENRG